MSDSEKTSKFATVYGIGGIISYNLTTEQMDVVNGVAVVSAVYIGGTVEIKAIRQMLKRT